MQPTTDMDTDTEIAVNEEDFLPAASLINVKVRRRPTFDPHSTAQAAPLPAIEPRELPKPESPQPAQLAIARSEPDSKPIAIAEPKPIAIAEPKPIAIAEPKPIAIAEPKPIAIAEPEPPLDLAPWVIAEPVPAESGQNSRPVSPVAPVNIVPEQARGSVPPVPAAGRMPEPVSRAAVKPRRTHRLMPAVLARLKPKPKPAPSASGKPWQTPGPVSQAATSPSASPKPVAYAAVEPKDPPKPSPRALFSSRKPPRRAMPLFTRPKQAAAKPAPPAKAESGRSSTLASFATRGVEGLIEYWASQLLERDKLPRQIDFDAVSRDWRNVLLFALNGSPRRPLVELVAKGRLNLPQFVAAGVNHGNGLFVRTIELVRKAVSTGRPIHKTMTVSGDDAGTPVGLVVLPLAAKGKEVTHVLCHLHVNRARAAAT